MRKMRLMSKRILATILAASLAVSFVGCNKDSDKDTNSGNENALSSFPINEAGELDWDDLVKTTEEVKVDSPLLPEEEMIPEDQMNSFSMMYYLAITSEEIRTSKNNRLMLEDINSSLRNDINPGEIDELTQDHIKNLREVIYSYIDVSTKRERLQYIYNQEKAAAMREAFPKPEKLLSLTVSVAAESANPMTWVNLAAVVTNSVVEYKGAKEDADNSFLMKGWELDDEELAAIRRNRDRSFDYMVDMVQEYGLDGMLTLNEKAVEEYAKICKIESIPERIKRLETEEGTYRLLGDYWLELADSYYEVGKYDKCLESVAKYNQLYTGIYRQDFNYAKILPKAIVAAKATYTDELYVKTAEKFADEIIQNTSTSDWASRYFAIQIYIDLYDMTQDQQYLEKAYQYTYDNVTVLLPEQRKLNEQYINDYEDLKVEKPDYRFMSKEEKKDAKKQYKQDKKDAKAYNKEMKKERKTELPHLYEPLVLNCEMLFALAEKLEISDEEMKDIEDVLQTSTNGIFMSQPVNNHFSFTSDDMDYDIDFSKKEIRIPAKMFTSGSKISVTVYEGAEETLFDDCVISQVERKGKTMDDFTAVIKSPTLKKYDWTKDSEIKITYTDSYENTEEFEYKVVFFEHHWYGDKVAFGEK